MPKVQSVLKMILEQTYSVQSFFVVIKQEFFFIYITELNLTKFFSL